MASVGVGNRMYHWWPQDQELLMGMRAYKENGQIQFENIRNGGSDIKKEEYQRWLQWID